MNTEIKILFCSVFLFLSLENGFAQYEYLSQYENLYPGCVDNEESVIFGGSYPNQWPKNLIPPVFPGGGDIQLVRFIANNLEYPEVLDFYTRERVKKTVLVEVVIDRCGKPTRQRVINEEEDDEAIKQYDKEALRIAKQFPVFKPGTVDGTRVKVALVIPFHFNRNTKPVKKEQKRYEDF